VVLLARGSRLGLTDAGVSRVAHTGNSASVGARLVPDGARRLDCTFDAGFLHDSGTAVAQRFRGGQSDRMPPACSATRRAPLGAAADRAGGMIHSIGYGNVRRAKGDHGERIYRRGWTSTPRSSREAPTVDSLRGQTTILLESAGVVEFSEEVAGMICDAELGPVT